MLQITEAAEGAIRRIREENELPDTAALRIAPVETPGNGMSIGFAFTEGPEEGDQTVSEKDDFRVYLAPELAGPFEKAELEATASEEGIELELRTQTDLHNNDHHGNHDHGSHKGHDHG